MYGFLRWLGVSIALSLTACASKPPIGQADLLAFLKSGETLRKEVKANLGSPDAEYAHGRILTFWLAADEAGYYRCCAALGSVRQFSLVLVFGKDDLLLSHALVKFSGR